MDFKTMETNCGNCLNFLPSIRSRSTIEKFREPGYYWQYTIQNSREDERHEDSFIGH